MLEVFDIYRKTIEVLNKLTRRDCEGKAFYLSQFIIQQARLIVSKLPYRRFKRIV